MARRRETSVWRPFDEDPEDNTEPINYSNDRDNQQDYHQWREPESAHSSGEFHDQQPTYQSTLPAYGYEATASALDYSLRPVHKDQESLTHNLSQLSFGSSSAPEGASGGYSKSKKRKPPHCQKCRVHGDISVLNNHSWQCPYKDCLCDKGCKTIHLNRKYSRESNHNTRRLHRSEQQPVEYSPPLDLRENRELDKVFRRKDTLQKLTKNVKF